jgi:hypothetical protein
MRGLRSSIGGLLAAVLAAALGFYALRSGSEAWTGGLFLLTQASLGLAWVGALCRRGEARAWWIGFALFGCIYLGCSFAPHNRWPKLPTQMLLDEIYARIQGVPVWFSPDAVAFEGLAFHIWHCLWTLLAAAFGGLIARTLFCAVAARRKETAGGAQATARARRNSWTGLSVLAISSLEMAALAAFGGKFLPAGLWAGLTFLLTLWLLGLFALRAYFASGKKRDFWLGAAALGTGFVILAFSRYDKEPWPILPTVELLDELRPWLPAVMSGYPAGWDTRTPENARVYAALERKVRMSFVDETPLEKVLKHIQMETVGTDGKTISIELTPIGVTERNLVEPTVGSVDFDGMPLRTTLKLCLDQLDLTYHVKTGAIRIHSKDGPEEAVLSSAKDAYQVVGHCVLALIAAAIGGALTRALSDASVCTGNRTLKPPREHNPR